jgi:hypothetical protein
MASLGELIRGMDALDDEGTLFAARPWSAGSDAACVVEDDESRQAVEAGLSYLLEVSVAKEVVETWGAWHGGRTPSATDAVRAIIYYAEHDTYPPN